MFAIIGPNYYYYKDLFTHKYKNTYINGVVYIQRQLQESQNSCHKEVKVCKWSINMIQNCNVY